MQLILNMPAILKRPQTAYFYFAKAMRESKYKDTKLAVPELGRELGGLWRGLSEEDRAEYKKLADEDKLRYKREHDDAVTSETPQYELPKRRKIKHRKKKEDLPKEEATEPAPPAEDVVVPEVIPVVGDVAETKEEEEK